jgi:hypothetical protein
MIGFLVKVTQCNGNLMSPITAFCKDAKTAEHLVRNVPFVDDDAKIEAREIRDPILKKAFGVQADDTVAVRVDWIWKGDEPVKQ